jgi:hypothetical protein
MHFIKITDIWIWRFVIWQRGINKLEVNAVFVLKEDDDVGTCLPNYMASYPKEQ